MVNKSRLKLASLPTTLLALLLALPAFSSSDPLSSAYTVPTPTNKSPNDPFRHILLNSPKKPGPPVCCLKPLTPLEPVDDGILLSFEEWKARQLAVRGDGAGRGDEGGSGGDGPEHDSGFDNNHQHDTSQNNVDGGDPSSHTIPSEHASSHDPGGGPGPGAGEITPTPHIIPPNTATSLVGSPSTSSLLSPHFRVPLTDRFNYANLDCSARIHTAHKQAKSPSSILSSKKDRYMLAPCTPTSPHGPTFIVAELCDDIRIDTVQLANFEFFSGVFKDFSVSVAKTYSSDPDDGVWTRVGTYRARNVRGVQSFHPPMELRGFYRFIRIEFETFYGNEYYCPVSLLRVYGLTHLEEWKWEVWEAESRERMRALQQAQKRQQVVRVEASVSSGTVEVIPSAPEGESVPSAEPVAVVGEDQQQQQQQHTSTVTDGPLTTATNADATDSGDAFSTSISTLPPSPSQTPTTHDATPSEHQQQHSSPAAPHLPQHTFPNITALASIITKVINISHAQSHHATSSNQTQTHLVPHSNTVSSAPPSTNLHTTPNNSHSSSSSPPPSQASSGTSSHMTPTVIISTDSASVTSIPSSHLPPPPPSGPGGGGESIYRMIMNRLVGVETNHTLYTRYMGQQHTALRDVIKRMGEDIGRLEGLGRAQSLTHQKALADWERQRFQLEMDQADLLSRLDLLSEEIILEKRLGIAQLCLLLVVLVFMGLTRGSRADTMASYTPPPTATTAFNVKEWGKRQLSLRSDWADRFTPSASGVGTPREGAGSVTPANGQQATTQTTKAVDSTTTTTTTRWGEIQSAPLNKSFAFPTLKDQDQVSSTTQRANHPLEAINLNHPHTSLDFGASSPGSQNRPPRARTRSGNNLSNAAVSSTSSSARPRSRTPSLRSLVTNRRPANARVMGMGAVTPTRGKFAVVRPQVLQRSSSHGGPGFASAGGAGMAMGAGGGLPLPFPLALGSGSGVGVGGTGSGYVPRSARKWARTAHLHPVPRRAGNGNGNVGSTSGSVSASRSGSPGKEKEKRLGEELSLISAIDIPGFGREVEVSEDEKERQRGGASMSMPESPALGNFALEDPPKVSRRRRMASLKSAAKGGSTGVMGGSERNGVAVPHGVESGVGNGQSSASAAAGYGGDLEEPDAWVDTDSLDGSEFGFGTGCDAADM